MRKGLYNKRPCNLEKLYVNHSNYFKSILRIFKYKMIQLKKKVIQ